MLAPVEPETTLYDRLGNFSKTFATISSIFCSIHS